MTETTTEPGHLMAGEMAQQPEVLRRLLHEGAPRIARTAAHIAARGPRFVLLTARGTSDNAALYGKYLLEILLGRPCGLTSMSVTTAYQARQDLTDCLVIAVSQSGGSPDLVASTTAARRAGAVTLAVTNNPDSPLAQASEYHIDILAGPERALPRWPRSVCPSPFRSAPASLPPAPPSTTPPRSAPARSPRGGEPPGLATASTSAAVSVGSLSSGPISPSMRIIGFDCATT